VNVQVWTEPFAWCIQSSRLY